MVHFYFDMDGVLSVFDEQACVEKPFNILGAHYFQSCEPDLAAIALLKSAETIPGAKTHILTRIYIDPSETDRLDDLLDEHVIDKKLWIERQIGREYADRYMSVCQVQSKSFVLQDISQDERKTRILIDDDPKILQDWTDHGGTGIQWIQPTRHVSKW